MTITYSSCSHTKEYILIFEMCLKSVARETEAKILYIVYATFSLKIFEICLPDILGRILDFKLSPFFECQMLFSGLFLGVCSLNATVSEHPVCSISYLLACEDGTNRVFRNVGI
jgi:hypothetical protein